jgi:hypothetical protein
VVAAAFGDVQVAGVFDGRDDGGADGGQVDGAAAGGAGRGVLGECHVPDVMVCLDGLVVADEPGQVARGSLRAGQAGDGVDGLAGGLPCGGVLPSPGDLDGMAGEREVQVFDMGGLEGAGLKAAVPASWVVLPGGTCLQGSALTRAYGSGWLAFTTAALAVLLRCQPVQVRPHRLQRIESHHGTGQVQGGQELSEMAGLVVLHIDLQVVQKAPDVLGDAEEVHPGAVAAAAPAGSLAIDRHGP